MNLGHLIMKKAQLPSDPRSTSPIRVRVAPVPGTNGTRKVQILPSSSSSRVVVTSSEAGKPSDNQTELLLKNYTNFEKSGVPDRIMVYDSDAWVDLKKEVFDILKSGFSQGKSMVEAKVDGKIFLFDFHRMMVTEFESAQKNSVAWIDVDGKCFFPKVYVDYKTEASLDLNVENLSEEGQKVVIEIQVVNDNESSSSKQNLSQGKRKIDEIIDSTSSNSRSNDPKAQAQAPRQDIITDPGKVYADRDLLLPYWRNTKNINPKHSAAAAVLEVLKKRN